MAWYHRPWPPYFTHNARNTEHNDVQMQVIQYKKLQYANTPNQLPYTKCKINKRTANFSFFSKWYRTGTGCAWDNVAYELQYNGYRQLRTDKYHKHFLSTYRRCTPDKQNDVYHLAGIQKEKEKKQNTVYSFACPVNEGQDGECRERFRPDYHSERLVIDWCCDALQSALRVFHRYNNAAQYQSDRRDTIHCYFEPSYFFKCIKENN